MSETIEQAVEILSQAPEASPNGAANSASQSNPPLEKDQYGRDAAERIVELSSDDAEAIGKEVVEGKWTKFDDALHYVLARGLAEIKRTRESALKNAAKTLLADKTDQWTTIMNADPKLLQNPQLVAKMFAEISELAAKAKPKKK